MLRFVKLLNYRTPQLDEVKETFFQKKSYLTEIEMCTCVELRARRQSEELDGRHAP